nr:MAG TPA: hypothetical protein [Caudoviricetes sp.]
MIQIYIFSSFQFHSYFSSFLLLFLYINLFLFYNYFLFYLPFYPF